MHESVRHEASDEHNRGHNRTVGHPFLYSFLSPTDAWVAAAVSVPFVVVGCVVLSVTGNVAGGMTLIVVGLAGILIHPLITFPIIKAIIRRIKGY